MLKRAGTRTGFWALAWENKVKWESRHLCVCWGLVAIAAAQNIEETGDVLKAEGG